MSADTTTTPPPLPGALAPLAQSERIEALDVVRGIALLGILLMNIEAFAGPILLSTTGIDPSLVGIDRIADTAVYLLVQGKFYLLFSLLFGMGFAVMAERADASGRAIVPLYLRRIATLMLIGVLHIVLLWGGDVLTTYALIALPLLLLGRAMPVGWLWPMALLIFTGVPLLSLASGALGELVRLGPDVAKIMREALAEQNAQMQALIAGERAAYGPDGSYGAAVVQRLTSTVTMLPNMLMIGGSQILSMFLLGAWFVRSGAILRPQTFPRLFAWLRWGALPLGFALVWVGCRMMPTLSFDRLDIVMGVSSALTITGSFGMSLGYLAWMLRLLPALRWAAPAGRMALTNYLGQSLVCSLVFYGYGLGYFEQMPRAWQVAFAIGLFAVQVLLSRLWLARFRFGPMEWLWRAATYGRWPSLRR